jgi:hypothetical protein
MSMPDAIFGIANELLPFIQVGILIYLAVVVSKRLGKF